MTSTTSRTADAEARDFSTMVGSEVPRLWTRPLRPLTPETSLGFEVIDFALLFLGVALYPWQKWLLIHALELNPDGTFRFRRVIVLVARQNGKSMLAAVLAAWWLFVDSDRFEERLPPFRFKVLGTAQNLDTAQDVWNLTGRWCDDENEGHVPALASKVQKLQRKNGQPGIYLANGAHYEVRAASRKGGRGKAAARVLMDEMREQQTWDAWDSVAQTTKAIFNSQLWGISNAGDVRSVVLRKQRDNLIADIEAWLSRGIDDLEAYANGELSAPTSALFEWSAPDGCALDDIDGILQANPSIGHGEITIEQCLQDARDMLEASYRTEVLCQWVTSAVKSFISPKDWRDRHTPIPDVRIARGARTVWAVDTSANRSTTWVGSAVLTESGKPFAYLQRKRTGMMWAPDYLEELATESGCWEVAVQARGCPAVEFIDELEKRGFTVHKLDGGSFALATGRMRDRVRDGDLIIVEQPDIDLAVEGGVVTDYAENKAWSRTKSEPVDIAGLVALTEALYALEVLTPELVPDPIRPPAAATVARSDAAPDEVNLATVAF
ncbi:hypothetical protein ACI3KS_05165 [Microbacterium sp. ZW T5_45]|uniref:hypothetical protein n=1 Tax=Microbacterium sp. ZW T5_45 TaxID=3378080 RepID=UPI0038531DF0